MAASLWSKALGLGLSTAARTCRSSTLALGTQAIRAGRSSSVRFASTAVHRKRSSLHSWEHPRDHPEPAGAAEEGPSPHIDQPKFVTLKDAIHPQTLSALTADPFKLVHMSPVQAAVLPLLPNLVRPHNPDETDGSPRDLMVKARTGTGKTLGFLVPAVEARLNALKAHANQVENDLMNKSPSSVGRAVEQYARTHVGALIISPTRELATQIANEAIKLTRHHDHFQVKLFTGGLPRERQKREWDRGRRDIVVATPGRLRDFMENEPGFTDALQTTGMFILDEADTLLEMGFIPDITAIAETLKPSPERQTFMFSATMSKEIRKIARETLSENHTFINCVPDDAPPTHHAIPQYFTTVPSAEEQLPHVLRLIAQDQLANPAKSKVLVFLPTTSMVQLYSTFLMQLGSSVLPAGSRTRFAEMHSKKSMDRRVATSDRFRRDRSGAMVMLTSDISARGVDYPGVTRVIQVSVPSSGDLYVHRVGRTGRGSNMNGRADIVLLPHEAGFLNTELSGVPIKELTTEDLKTQVAELVEKYEQSPVEFFPNIGNRSPRLRDSSAPFAMGFPQGVKERVGGVEEQIKSLQADINPDDITGAMQTVLAFYVANSHHCRENKAATVAGVQSWVDALTGQHVPMRVPQEWKDRAPFRSRFGNSRGGASQRKTFGLRQDKSYKREPEDFKRHDSRSYDWNSDVSDRRQERRGHHEKSWTGRGSNAARRSRSYGSQF